MLTEIISNTYENGKRVSVQRITYNKSEDFMKYGSLQQQYEKICSQLEAGTGNKDFLVGEKERLHKALAEQKAILDGYEAAESDESEGETV